MRETTVKSVAFLSELSTQRAQYHHPKQHASEDFVSVTRFNVLRASPKKTYNSANTNTTLLCISPLEERLPGQTILS